MGDGGRTPLANGTDRELFVWNEQQSYLAYVLSRTFFCILLLLAEAECSPLDGMAARGINLLPRESSSLLAPRTNAKVNAVQIDNLKAKCVVCPTTNDFFSSVFASSFLLSSTSTGWMLFVTFFLCVCLFPTILFYAFNFFFLFFIYFCCVFSPLVLLLALFFRTRHFFVLFCLLGSLYARFTAGPNLIFLPFLVLVASLLFAYGMFEAILNWTTVSCEIWLFVLFFFFCSLSLCVGLPERRQTKSMPGGRTVDRMETEQTHSHREER